MRQKFSLFAVCVLLCIPAIGRAAIVINEFQYDDTGTDEREFVELYNSGSTSVDVSGWTLGGRDSTTTNPIITIPLGSTISPGAYYVVGNPGVPGLSQSVEPGFLENDSETLELWNGTFGSSTLIDAVVYEGSFSFAIPAGVVSERGPAPYWPNHQGFDISTGQTLTAVARYISGLDTNNNGRDFAMRPSTPGAANSMAAMTQYVVPYVDALPDASTIGGLTGSFVGARVFTPGTVVAGLNPNSIPAPPQSSKAIIAWDPTGGGNGVVSDAIFDGGAQSFDIYAYLDTNDLPVSTNASDVAFRGSEASYFGLGGAIDAFTNLASVSGQVGLNAANSLSGATGLAWYYEKVGVPVGGAGSVSEKLYLIDAGDGGNMNTDPANTTPDEWQVLATFDLANQASGWHRLAINVDELGNGLAIFDSNAIPFETEAGLVGSFYVGYRENTQAGSIGVPNYVRPATFTAFAPVTAEWTNVDGGASDLPTNWLNNAPPGPNSNVVFGLPNVYTVTLSSSATTGPMFVRSGDVTINLQGNDHTVSPNSPVRVADLPGEYASLTILGGGDVNYAALQVGSQTGANGNFVLTGNGTHLTSDVFVVGASGIGSATISGGAQLEIQNINQDRVYIGIDSGATGVLTVTGVGSKLFGTTGPAITVGGVYHTDTTGYGVLNVADGGVVESTFLVVGNRSQSRGDVNVTGPGSELHSSVFATFGDDGVGTVAISNQGALESGDGGAAIGHATNGVGSVTLESASTWQSFGPIWVGNAGVGQFAVEGGSDVISPLAVVGAQPSGVGDATITGSGSTWTTRLYVGDSGIGLVTIEEGGQINTDGGAIGSFENSIGDVIVTGSGSQLNVDPVNAADFNVGVQGLATLTVSEGAHFIHHDGNTFVGRGRGSEAAVLVTDAGSLWESETLIIATSEGNLTSPSEASVQLSEGAQADVTFGVAVGHSGNGSLAVDSGATLNSGSGVIGHSAGAVGQATVNGAGSSWQMNGNLDVGAAGQGTLNVSNGGAVTVGGALNVLGGGILGGNGKITGNVVVNGGLVRPGNSPGIITIDGNYTQLSNGVLEVEVGGLVPGSEHDQIVVNGNASLAGQLYVPVFGSYVPVENHEVTFLTASTIEGQFTSITSPNLASVNANLAIQLSYDDPQSVKLRFVAASRNIQFVTQEAEASWTGFGTWTDGDVPDSTNIVTVTNLSGAPQQVNVTHGSAFVHELNVVGQTDTIKLSIQNGSSFSATTSVTIDNKAAVELVNQASLVSTQVAVQPGGVLSGNGTVVGNLVVGAATGATEAKLSPGLSAGHLDVQGNYEQRASGTLAIEIDGTAAGQFDTMNVTGEAKLGGQLVIDASEFQGTTPGTTFAILQAGELVEGAIFSDVKTVGNNSIFFAPIYSTGPAGQVAGEGLASGSEVGACGVDVLCVGQFNKGDMNRNGAYDPEDVEKFALALTKPIDYFGEFGIFGHESGNIDGSANGLDFDDIDDFAQLVPGTSVAAVAAAIHAQLHAVPEPTAFALMLWGGCFMTARRAGSRRTARL